MAESPDTPTDRLPYMDGEPDEWFARWMSVEVEVHRLRAEVECLRADNRDLTADNAHLRERIRLMARMDK